MCSRVPRLGWKRCWKRGSSRPWLRLETRSTAARPCLACLAQVRKTHEVLRHKHFQRKLRSINSWKARSDPKPMKVSVLKTWHIVAWLPTKVCINCAASHYSATASFQFLIFSPHFSMSSGSCCETSKSERVPIKGSQLRSANCSNLAMENHEEMQQKHSETWNRRWLWGNLHSFHDMESKVVNLRRHQTMAWAIRHWLSRHGPSVFCCRTYDLDLALAPFLEYQMIFDRFDISS